jgi:hypothetical protein
MTDKELFKLALELLDAQEPVTKIQKDLLRESLRAKLMKPDPEAVAWFSECNDLQFISFNIPEKNEYEEGTLQRLYLLKNYD